MKERQVILPLSVREYLGEIADYIIELSTHDHALRYVHELVAEINHLSYLADALPASDSLFVLKYHEKAKRFNAKHGVWCVIFHIDGDFVIIDRILPAKLVTS
jgi:plasmid stabilization system protein ParE